MVGSSVQESVDFYNRWNEEVKKSVPADRLLVIFLQKIFFKYFIKQYYKIINSKVAPSGLGGSSFVVLACHLLVLDGFEQLLSFALSTL